eukprot:3775792-Pleurochrysis_carterae.AAC.1
MARSGHCGGGRPAIQLAQACARSRVRARACAFARKSLNTLVHLLVSIPTLPDAHFHSDAFGCKDKRSTLAVDNPVARTVHSDQQVLVSRLTRAAEGTRIASSA